jgi:hypothetical protein
MFVTIIHVLFPILTVSIVLFLPINNILVIIASTT